MLLAAFFATLGAPQAASAAGPLHTGFLDPINFGTPERQDAAFARAQAAGATTARLQLVWRNVAPVARPLVFDPANPLDVLYRWSDFDRQVQLAHSRGQDPIVSIIFAPDWAQGPGAGPTGTVLPDPVAFGNFARAAALRYSGLIPGLPRVRYWMAWGEPNRDNWLTPQYQNGELFSAGWYRAMVQRFAEGVYGANPTNRIVAGGLAPHGRPNKPAPLAFMRSMLCVTRSLGRACDLRGTPVPVDVWAHHAYTSGAPTRRARARDDVAFGDLGKLRRVLRAAVRLGHVRSHGPISLWVTEVSWDSSPPDPRAVPAALHARWTSEALYRAWQDGVSRVIWWRIQDDPLSVSPYQSGFFSASGRAKRSLTAFRFPVVAFRRGGRIAVWGRTPSGRPGRVVVQIRTRGGWQKLATVRTNGHGIFSRSFRSRARNGSVRARLGREASVPFSLARHRDRVFNPFGCGGAIPC